MRRRWQFGIALGMVFAGAQVTAYAGMNPDSLRLSRTAEEVRLSWVGNGPAYVIYRADEPTAVDAPASFLSTSSDQQYADPMGAIPCSSCFYIVHSAPGFDCGEAACAIDDQYCFILYPGVPEAPPQHQCLTTPAECVPSPTCPCVQSAIAGEWPPPSTECVQNADDAITISVYAP